MVTTTEALTALYPNAVLGMVPGEGDYTVVDGQIDYWSPALGPEPTPEQLAAVTEQQVTDAQRGREPFLRDLLDDAQARIAQIDTYLAIPNPTNAQVAAEVRRLVIAQRRVIQALARLIVREWRA